MIKLGCCSNNFRERSLDEALRLISDLGFRFVDVGASDSWTQVGQEAAAADPAGLGSEVHEIAKAHGLTLAELAITYVMVDGASVQTNDPDASVRRRLLKQYRGICQFAAQAGFQSIMGVPGIRQDALGEQGAWDVTATVLTDMVAIAKEYGVLCNLEPAIGTLLQTPDAAVRMARQVPGLGYSLDYAHFVAQRIPQRDVAPVHEFTRHMHAKQARVGYRKTLFHEGDINYAAIIGELKQRNWDGVIVMECIGGPSGQAEIPYPVYRDILGDGEVVAAQPGMVSLSVTQTVLHAYELARIIGGSAMP